MTIQLFSLLADRLGDSVTISVPDAVTAGELKAQLAADYPGLAELIEQSTLAVNQAYVPDEALVPGMAQEVALIPPVSGG